MLILETINEILEDIRSKTFSIRQKIRTTPSINYYLSSQWVYIKKEQGDMIGEENLRKTIRKKKTQSSNNTKTCMLTIVKAVEQCLR